MDAASALSDHHRPARSSAPTSPASRRRRSARCGARSAPIRICIARVPAERFPPQPPSDRRRRSPRAAQLIGGNLSIAYREPVKIVRGWMQYLYDDEGRRYLDAYNNVPHVGHCHPRVVDAAATQMRVLNTNTRYLNDLLDRVRRAAAGDAARRARRLLLRELGERGERARAAPGARVHRRRDMIVLEAAYHGNTTSLIDISPYKHAGPGGSGAPDWVHVAPLPDVYRGAYKRERSGRRREVRIARGRRSSQRRARARSRRSRRSSPRRARASAGRSCFRRGYLANVYEHVRAAGGVCIADEVQTGLGRMGTSFWAFEDQGVVPDIVVMGKPLGNGHPIGAVVDDARDRRRVRQRHGVLQHLRRQHRVVRGRHRGARRRARRGAAGARARAWASRCCAGLRALVERYPIVGDVRGSGLFLGVELVRDRETLEPAGAEASFVANRMRERGILLGTDGPYHNVVKIRPPMPFTAADGHSLLSELETALRQLP